MKYILREITEIVGTYVIHDVKVIERQRGPDWLDSEGCIQTFFCPYTLYMLPKLIQEIDR